MIFFTSDTHFGHKHICEYSKRPFSSIEEHDEALIQNWNAVVTPRDVVYHLGDVSLCGKEQTLAIVRRLHGDIHLIRGNHEGSADSPGIRERFHFIKDLYYLKTILNGEKIRIVLCHYAMRRWPDSHKGSWMLHGHSHGELPEETHLSFDVGVDCWNYTPVSLEQVAAKMALKIKAGCDVTTHHEPREDSSG